MSANWDDGWSSDNKEKAEPRKQDIKEPYKHQLHFAREKRNGKVVTIAKPFFLSKTDMEDLLKKLKKSLATGGTIKDNTLEFQGEVSEKLKTELIKLEFNLKK